MRLAAAEDAVTKLRELFPGSHNVNRVWDGSRGYVVWVYPESASTHVELFSSAREVAKYLKARKAPRTGAKPPNSARQP